MATLLVLAGAKAVGKSWVADIAQREFGVHHVETDALILDLIKRGKQPDPQNGWLAPVEAAVLDALQHHDRVSVEISGGWDRDYVLMRDATANGHTVKTLWITTSLDESLDRLVSRRATKVPTSEADARAFFEQARQRAIKHRWDAALDTSGDPNPEAAAAMLQRLLT